MKKIISLFIFAVAILVSSCTNDDITISKTVNFTVDPSDVASTFTAGEINAGDLESFDQDCRLNIKLFIYDQEGTLVNRFSDTYSNYLVQMKNSVMLPQGNYTAVAISHVDNTAKNIRYWYIEGEENLEGLRIVDGGYIGGKNKILGVSVSNFTVNDNIIDLNIKVQPAGSIFTVYFQNYNIMKYVKVEKVKLEGDKTFDYVEFDRSGNSNVIEDNHNGSFDWLYATMNPQNNSAYTIYSYQFVLPMKNINMRFMVEWDDEDEMIGNKISFNFEKGKCYYAFVNCDDWKTGSGTGKYNYSKSVLSKNIINAEKTELKPIVYMGKESKKQTIYIKDMK